MGVSGSSNTSIIAQIAASEPEIYAFSTISQDLLTFSCDFALLTLWRNMVSRTPREQVMSSTDLVPADDPQRCTGTTPSGQCPSRSLPGTNKCAAHGGAVASKSFQRRQYLLEEARLSDRVSHYSSHESIYSLREEIALTRVLIEKLLSQPNVDLTLQAPALISLFQTLEKLVKTSSQVEVKLGAMLSKDTVFKLAAEFIDIVSEHIKDIDGYEERIDSIIAEIKGAASEAKDTDDSE